jgi:16S rRNA (adenine1518-N6/adenine1519-N6)-dimethyltransferase
MEEIKNILKKYSARPNETLGQNFLIDEAALAKIVEAAELSQNDVVLEVGPGTGILTKELAKRTKKVIAVEKDPKMVEIIKQETKDYNNVEIIEGDILKLDNKEIEKLGPYKVVANIPYYLTSHLIRIFLEPSEVDPPTVMILLLQKEVAERICSTPPDMSLLSVSVQFYAEPKLIDYVPKESFWPVPKVDSAILKIVPQINSERKNIDIKKFFKIVKAGFSQPRKQLLNNFSKSFKIDKK